MPKPPRYRIPPSTRLRRAIHTNDELLTKRILTSHPSLLHNPDFTPQGLSNTSLHLASSLGHLHIVTLLLSLDHETPTSISLNEDYQTPLMLAAKEGHTDVVHALCESGLAGVGRQDRRGRDAVMFAALGGHDTCLQILLTFAPPVPYGFSYDFSHNANAAYNTSMTTKTSSAVFDAPSPVTALLSHADADGNTALHFASANGHLMVLRTLLAAGADAERRNVWSWTPVSYSATVAAEVYFKNLVAEVEKRRQIKREVESKGLGGGLRLVSAEDG